MSKATEENGLMTIPELMEYMDIGQNLAYRFVKQIGAEVKVGRKIFVSKKIVDDYLTRKEREDYGKKEVIEQE